MAEKKTMTSKGVCSRCGSTDNPRPLPKRWSCRTCADRLLCYGCDTQHNVWCSGANIGSRVPVESETPA